MPIITFAEGIENFYINATLELDGDLRVQEYFNLDGEFNGFQRIINYQNAETYKFRPELDSYGGSELHNGSDIEINEIRAVDINSKFDFQKIKGDKFEEVVSAEKGDYGVYIKTRDYDGYIYTIYLPSDEEKAFYLDYTIKNIAILHEDVGELGWNIFTALEENVKNLEVTINFPNNETEFKVWAHGPLNGLISKENNNTLKATVGNLRANKAVDIRATFDKKIISNSSKKSNVVALDKILKYEESKAEQANYERAQTDYQRQTEAQEKIWYCYETLERVCYNEAVTLVNRVSDKTVSSDLRNQLDKLNILITEQEELRAKESVTQAEDNPTRYSYYEQALEDTEVLTNQELKNELLTRLDVVKENIIEYEKESYNKFKLYNYGIIIAIIVILIYVYYTHDREYKTAFTVPYLRELPNHYSPTTVSYLFTRKISNDSISAEILRMINKKIILCKKIEKGTKKKEDYELEINPEYKEELTDKETKLIKLIFDKKTKIELKELKKKASSSYRSFLNRWDAVKEKCTNLALEEEIYIDDVNAKYQKGSNGTTGFIQTIITIIAMLLIYSFIFLIPGVFLLIYSSKINLSGNNLEIKKDTSKRIAITLFIIAIIFSSMAIIYNIVFYHFLDGTIKLPLIIIALSVSSLIYTSLTKKRTENGAYEYARWLAFKRFLNDFGKMDIKEIQEIKLWNEYLVYATVLGCADKVQKAMKLRVNELGLSDNDIFLSDIYIHNEISNSINRTLKDSYSSATASKTAASSGGSSSGGSWSSGGGGGGGFSSGGGSFGGGGGGGRF